MKRLVRLHGDLAIQFGKDHFYSVTSAAEAVRALIANFPKFQNYLIESETLNVGYKVLINNDIITPDPDGLRQPIGQSHQIDIVPVIGGAKSGFFQVVLGAALIAAAIWVPGLGTAITFGSLGFSTSLASIAFGLGTSMILGGISSMLAPQPKSGSPSERPENQPSYYFNGPVNTTAQGHPVPVGYGQLYIGSQVISAGITADDYTALELA